MFMAQNGKMDQSCFFPFTRKQTFFTGDVSGKVTTVVGLVMFSD